MRQRLLGRGKQPDPSGQDTKGPRRLLPTLPQLLKPHMVKHPNTLQTFTQAKTPAPRRTVRKAHPESHSRPQVPTTPHGQCWAWIQDPRLSDL